MATGWKGGDRLEAYLKDKVAKTGNAKTVSVGFLAGSTEADGTSVPMIAAIQEYGAPKANIPPRPFFRNMIAAHKDEWGPDVEKYMKAHDYNAELVLNYMGEKIGGELRQSIVDTNEPALSPVTLMLRQMKTDNPSLRGRITKSTVAEAAARVAAGKPYKATGTAAKPLVDTGTMLQSVDYQVE